VQNPVQGAQPQLVIAEQGPVRLRICREVAEEFLAVRPAALLFESAKLSADAPEFFVELGGEQGALPVRRDEPAQPVLREIRGAGPVPPEGAALCGVGAGLLHGRGKARQEAGEVVVGKGVHRITCIYGGG